MKQAFLPIDPALITLIYNFFCFLLEVVPTSKHFILREKRKKKEKKKKEKEKKRKQNKTKPNRGIILRRIQRCCCRRRRRRSGSRPRRCSAATAASAGLCRRRPAARRRRSSGAGPSSRPARRREHLEALAFLQGGEFSLDMRKKKCRDSDLIVGGALLLLLLLGYAGERVASPELLVLLPDGLAPPHLLVLPRPQRLRHLCASTTRGFQVAASTRMANRSARTDGC